MLDVHLLCGTQGELVNAIAERIQTLGGVSVAMAADVAETTMLARPPRDREEPLLQLVRLIDAHERVLYSVRAAVWRITEVGDDGTRDLLVRELIRTNERQAWFVHEHLQRGRLSRAS
jgi:starvation-inducible DNA-binding protein